MPVKTLPKLCPAYVSGENELWILLPNPIIIHPFFQVKKYGILLAEVIVMGLAKKILIVDDEEDLCLLMKIYFTRKQYDVSIANTLQDGLSKLEKLNPDILFLDNNLPDGLGWDEAPAILDKYPDLNIHLISAFHPTVPQHAEQHRLRVMEKPFTQQQLNELGL